MQPAHSEVIVKNTWNGVGLLVMLAGALLLVASSAAVAWNGWLSPLLTNGSDEGSALATAFLGPLWLIGLPLVVAGGALWWFSKPRSTRSSRTG